MLALDVLPELPGNTRGRVELKLSDGLILIRVGTANIILVGQLHQPERTKGHIHGEGYGRHQPVYGQNPVRPACTGIEVKYLSVITQQGLVVKTKH